MFGDVSTTASPGSPLREQACEVVVPPRAPAAMIAESPADTALVVVTVIVVEDVTFVVTAKRLETKLAATHPTVTVHVILSVSDAPLLIAVNVALASMGPVLAVTTPKMPASAIAALVASPAAQSPT